MNIYKNKYIKYKNKYLELKKGGTLDSENDLLKNYYIISSHNTYLESNQLIGTTNIFCYLNFIKKYGGGCVEFDIIKIMKKDGNEDVIISHKNTLSESIYLREILSGIYTILNDTKINKYGPVILSFDNKSINKYCEHQIIWKLLKEILKEYLYTNYEEENLTISNVKNKVLIKWKQSTKICNCDCNCAKNCKDKCITESKKKCIDTNLFKINENIEIESKQIESKKIESKERWTHLNQFNTESHTPPEYNLTDYNKLSKNSKNIISKYIKLTKTKFIRVYPHGKNVLSGNYDFYKNLILGIQLIALNIQKQDIQTMTQMEFFRNGCLRKKPECLIEDNNIDNNIDNIITKILTKEDYTLIFDNDLKYIKIYVYDSQNYLELKNNKIKISILKNFKQIYIKCIYNNNKYKGSITLNENINYLYKIDKYSINNCNWFSDKNLKDKIQLRCELNENEKIFKCNIKHITDDTISQH